MQANQLPIHLSVYNPKRVGRKWKNVFVLCLFGLILSWLMGEKLDRNAFLVLGSCAIVGLGMWATRVAYYRDQKIEIVVEADHISFSRILLNHPNIWSQFRNGTFIRIPWSEITRWDFTDPVEGSRGADWYPTEYSLRIRSVPGTILILDREPLIEIEDRFIPQVRQILLAHNHEFYGLEG